MQSKWRRLRCQAWYSHAAPGVAVGLVGRAEALLRGHATAFQHVHVAEHAVAVVGRAEWCGLLLLLLLLTSEGTAAASIEGLGGCVCDGHGFRLRSGQVGHQHALDCAAVQAVDIHLYLVGVGVGCVHHVHAAIGAEGVYAHALRGGLDGVHAHDALVGQRLEVLYRDRQAWEAHLGGHVHCVHSGGRPHSEADAVTMARPAVYGLRALRVLPARLVQVVTLSAKASPPPLLLLLPLLMRRVQALHKVACST